MRVHYMNGAGNDFMVMDARDQKLDFSSLAIKRRLNQEALTDIIGFNRDSSVLFSEFFECH